MRFVNLLIFLLILCPHGYAHELERLPERDREKIEFLFTFLVQCDTLGFLLFGENKCLTFTGIPITHKKYFLPYKIEDGYKFQKKLKESWYTWKHYESRLKHPNYLICEKYDRIENETYLQIFIFDKKKLRNTLEKYQEDFIEALGASFTPEGFIANLEKKQKVMPLIKHDEKLLGILLGFGRDASTAFRDFDQNEELDPPLEYLGKRPLGCVITPVSFRGYKSSPETTELLEKYKKEIIEIEKIFKSDDFLKKVIESFCAS
jgi:hypothetical protein